MRILLTVFLILLGNALPALAQDEAAVACEIPVDQKPSLRVDLEISQPVMDYTKSRADLKRFEINSISPYGNGENVHVNGLTRGAVGFETKTGLHWVRYEKMDQNCFWYAHVGITIKLKPTVYLASEIPKDSCMYREVLNHEFQHVATDDRLAHDYQVILQDEIERFIQQTPAIGPYTTAQKQQAQDWLTKRLDYTVQAIFARLNTDRLKRQALIDTKQEYDRVAHLCPGQIGTM